MTCEFIHENFITLSFEDLVADEPLDLFDTVPELIEDFLGMLTVTRRPAQPTG